MSEVSTNLLGLSLDEGAAFFVKESAQSESGVASMSNVLLETYKFVGSQMRAEYLMPQMTQMNWALRALQNQVPECQLLLDEGNAAPSPLTTIAKYDELMEKTGGSAAAPALRVIPGYAVLQNAYKTAESMQDSLLGGYNLSGYVRQKGPIDIEPEPLTQKELTEIGAQMSANWVPMFSAIDLETIAHLIKLVKVWQNAALGGGNVPGSADTKSLLGSMAIYGDAPAWAEHVVEADKPTGMIKIDGVPTTNPALIRAAFPDFEMPYQGGTRKLATWAQRHNEAMLEVPQYADIRRIHAFPDQTVVLQRYDNSTARPVTAGDLDFSFDDEQRRNIAVFELTFPTYSDGRAKPGAKTEIMAVRLVDPASGAVIRSVQTAKSLAWNVWKESHSGLPNHNESGFASAKTICAIREKAGFRGMLVPAVRKHLARMREALLHCGVPEVQDICAILVGVEEVKTIDDLNQRIVLVDDRLKHAHGHFPQIHDLGNGVEHSLTGHGFTVIGSGRYAPTEESCVALVPIRGRGVAPIVYERAGDSLSPVKALNVAVVLEEAPATVYSPVRTMIATALLNRLLQYLDGYNTPVGYNFDPYDPSNPYGLGQNRPCPHALLNRQLDRYEQALVSVIDNANVEQMPDVLRAAQKLADAHYFLNHVDEVVESIIDREDWIYMLQSLIIGTLAHDGAQITDTVGKDIVSVEAGVVPREAAEFIFGSVLRDLRASVAYQNAVDAALNYGLTAPANIANAANLARIVRAEVLFGRACKGLDLLKSLLDGSNELVSNVHVGSIQHLIDVDLSNELMQALSMVFNRDYLGLIDKVEFEAPWDCAEWTTSFGAFAFSVASEPIAYQAVDVAREIAVESGLSAVTSALARVGFEWSEIAPADLRVRSAYDKAAYVLGPQSYMAGQGGTGNPGYYNNASVAHQGLKVTVICPSYDIEAYNLVKAYLTMNTSRTYFAQVVGRDIADRYTIRLPINASDPLLDLLLADGPARTRRHALAQHGLEIEKTPALANVAMIMPYVSNYLQKTAITRDVAVPQIIQIDEAKSLANVSGVTIVPDTHSFTPQLLTERNGLAITVAEKRSVSTALPWVGS